MSLFDANGRPLKKAAPKRTAPEGEPVIETTHAENLAARKFLMFLLSDVHYQAKAIAEDTRVSREDIAHAKGPMTFLHNYLSQQIMELDRIIGIVEKEQPEIERKLLTALEAASSAIN